MSVFHVLITHNLTTYASALAGVLGQIRPHFHVLMVAPADLDGELVRFPDALVVSDSISPAVKGSSGGWILYYPNQENVAVVNVDGREHTVPNPVLEDVLTALDIAAALRPSGMFAESRGIPRREQSG